MLWVGVGVEVRQKVAEVGLQLEVAVADLRMVVVEVRRHLHPKKEVVVHLLEEVARVYPPRLVVEVGRQQMEVVVHLQTAE